MQPARPKHASTVILVRSTQHEKFAVLMTQRPEWMDVLGGHYVFPGGILEEEDCSAEMRQRCRGLAAAEAREILGTPLNPEVSLGHWIAAARELYEETGILLAVREDGGAVDAEGEQRQQELEAARKALVRGTLSFARVLEAAGLYCDVSRLSYFMHRITPEENRVRFDTRFFVARLPCHQVPLTQSEEVAQSVWVSPAQALTRSTDGRMPMIRPTRIVLERLAQFRSLAELLQAYPAR